MGARRDAYGIGSRPRSIRGSLYDLLGVSPDADDETLKKAYRKAAKAHHPDLNANDPDAPRRFKQIAAAIEILRDAEQRAAYDGLLEFERQQRRLRWIRIVVADAIAVAVVGVALVGGYALFAPFILPVDHDKQSRT